MTSAGLLLSNPHELVACKEQVGKKAMCWTGLILDRRQGAGPLLGVVEGGMDGEVYRKILEDFVWPAVRGIATRNQLSFMQDGD